MADETAAVFLALGVGVVGVAAIWYLSKRGNLFGDSSPQQINSNCTFYPSSGNYCWASKCNPMSQGDSICVPGSCAAARSAFVAGCANPAIPYGGSTAPVKVNQNCTYYPSSRKYCWASKCNPQSAGDTFCSDSCDSARSGFISACNNPNVPYGPGGGGGGGVQPCVSDCACVRGANPNISAICPAGNRSCTACWRRRGSTTPCNPTAAEKSAYGLSCAPSTGQPSVLFTQQVNTGVGLPSYNRTLYNPNDQMRLLVVA